VSLCNTESALRASTVDAHWGAAAPLDSCRGKTRVLLPLKTPIEHPDAFVLDLSGYVDVLRQLIVRLSL
jgi:hypothetical protein